MGQSAIPDPTIKLHKLGNVYTTWNFLRIRLLIFPGYITCYFLFSLAILLASSYFPTFHVSRMRISFRRILATGLQLITIDISEKSEVSFTLDLHA